MENLKKEFGSIAKLSKEAGKELQSLLNKNGYNLTVDGIVGKNTIRAFNDFKAKNNLSHPNEIGEMSLKFLLKTPVVRKEWHEINWNDFNDQITPNFTVQEVTQGDRRRIPTSESIKKNIVTLARELEIIRKAWGSPLTVTSWYRPPAVNREVGGATNSQHLTGSAVDLKPSQGDIYKFQSWLDLGLWQGRALGYGAKKGFVHIDMRPGRIRWNY